MKEEVPFIRPVFPDPSDLAKDLEEIIARNRFTNKGPFEERFSAALSDYLGKGLSVALTANATMALMLAIKHLFPAGKSEVIVQSFTFPAGPQAILWCGFHPIFVDIQPRTWQADLDEAVGYIEKRQAAVAGILLCNTFGVGNPQISDWEDVAANFGLPLIVDSAAGFGSLYNGTEKLGGRGDCEIFSFHATKPLAIGEGGAVVSRSQSLIDVMNRSSNFGFDENGRVTHFGLNAKLTEIACAIGIRQLSTLDVRLLRRRASLAVYQEHLSSLGIEFQRGDVYSSVPFVSASLPDSVRRDRVTASMHSAGIQSRRYYNPPVHTHCVFKAGGTVGNLEKTNALCKKVISLPTLEGDERTIRRVCQLISRNL